MIGSYLRCAVGNCWTVCDCCAARVGYLLVMLVGIIVYWFVGFMCIDSYARIVVRCWVSWWYDDVCRVCWLVCHRLFGV